MISWQGGKGPVVERRGNILHSQENTVNHKTIIILILLGTLFPSTSALAQEKDHPFLIRLGSTAYLPTEGERYLPLSLPQHLLVQFHEIPDSEKRLSLKKLGISLLNYVGGNTYIASLSESGVAAVDGDSNIRATVPLNPSMKLSTLIRKKSFLPHVFVEEPVIPLRISFHEDIAFHDAKKILNTVGLATDQKDFLYFKAIKTKATGFELDQLLESDEVKYIDHLLPKPAASNADAAERINSDKVYRNKDFNRPTGKNVKVGIWDGGRVDRHIDFGNRLKVIETSKDVSAHATHVAGIFGGSGKKDLDAKGIAGKVSIYSFDFDGEVFDEMDNAITDYGIVVTNNSYGTPAGWNYYETDSEDEDEESYWSWIGTELFGTYHSEIGDGDRLAREKNVTIVFSAGNERDDAYLGKHKHYNPTTGEHEGWYEDLHPSDRSYGTVKTFSAAKNFIVAGATMKDDYMTSFSSWGPTNSGRLKPDVVAPGSIMYSTLPGNAYGYSSGTSMSAPVVTGAASLIIDFYRRETKKQISSALVKALIIHAARDLGKKGPDFAFGFGMVDAKLSAQVLKAALQNPTTAANTVAPSKKSKSDLAVIAAVYEGSVDHKKKDIYSFVIPQGVKELRATLVWHDPPGDQLINDLDLWLKPSRGKKVRPFTLDPAKPGIMAKQKTNHTDNVEHILVTKPSAGAWKICVKGTSIPDGPQPYAFVISASNGNDAQVKSSTGRLGGILVFTSGIEGDAQNRPEEKSTFNKGDDFFIQLLFRLDKNADYGGFYGTIDIHHEIRRGAEIILESDVTFGSVPPNNPTNPNEVWRVPSPKYTIPENLQPGSYTVNITVELANGESLSDNTSFTVQ